MTDVPKQYYTPPQIKRWGTVADLTHTGLSRAGDDVMPAMAGRILGNGSVTDNNAGGGGSGNGSSRW